MSWIKIYPHHLVCRVLGPGTLIHILQRVIRHISIFIVRLRIPRIRVDRVRLNESRNFWIVVTRFIKIQTTLDVVLLPRETWVRLQIWVEDVFFLAERLVLDALDQVALIVKDPAVLATRAAALGH